MVNPFKNFSRDNDDEKEYVCQSCGEDWEGEATAFYVDGRCVHCGAPGSSNRIIKNKDNPLLRNGEDNE